MPAAYSLRAVKIVRFSTWTLSTMPIGNKAD
jgi:hypothetical protein